MGRMKTATIASKAHFAIRQESIFPTCSRNSHLSAICFLAPWKNEKICPVVTSIPTLKPTGENKKPIHFSNGSCVAPTFLRARRRRLRSPTVQPVCSLTISLKRGCTPAWPAAGRLAIWYLRAGPNHPAVGTPAFAPCIF